MTQPDRIPCVVPFCNRTRKPWPVCEWICGNHWRLISSTSKRVLFRLHRRMRKAGTVQELVCLRKREGRIWNTIKKQAIEAAAGIA